MSNSAKIALISVFIILIVSVGGFSYNILNNTTIYNGVSIDDLEVGGFQKEEAKDYLENILKNGMQNRKMALSNGNYTKEVKYKDLGIDYEYQKSVEEAYQIGRRGNILDRMKEIFTVSLKGKNIELKIKKDDNKIVSLVEVVNSEISSGKKDATIKYSEGKFIVTDEVIGVTVDKKKLTKNINDGIMVAEFIEIPIIEDKPKMTKELLSLIDSEIGSYSTSFGLEDSNRVHNVQLAAKSIDGRVVLPGDVFSFNETTGPRSKSAGYKEATVIMNGEFVPGEGGGVCQVSSTLYNTLLNSKMDIVERHRHTLPVGYVPEERDATVAYGYLDLKFRNSSEAPIYIKADVIGNQLIIKLFGKNKA